MIVKYKITCNVSLGKDWWEIEKFINNISKEVCFRTNIYDIKRFLSIEKYYYIIEENKKQNP